MTSSTSLHATTYNEVWHNLGLVWVVISTWLTASSYRQHIYSRPVTGMLHMLYKLVWDVALCLQYKGQRQRHIRLQYYVNTTNCFDAYHSYMFQLKNKTSSDQQWKISTGLLWYYYSVLKRLLSSDIPLFIIRQYCQQHTPQYINCDRPNSPHISPSTQTSGWRVGSSCFWTTQMPQPTHRPMDPPCHSNTKSATLWTCLRSNLWDENKHHKIKYIVQVAP
jgi:hypothetical protein